MLLSLVIFVVMSVLASYVATNNLEPITINLLGYPVHGTTGMLVVTALGIGVLLGVVMILPAYISRSWALIRHRRKLQDLQDRQGKPPLSVDDTEV